VGVHADARTARGEIAEHLAALGPEVLTRVLGQDTELDGVAARDDVRLVDAERLTGRDPDLQSDQVDAGAHLGNWMLNLDAAVDLDEVGLSLGVHQELQRAQVLVPGLDHGSDGFLAEILALDLGQAGLGVSSMIF